MSGQCQLCLRAAAFGMHAQALRSSRARWKRRMSDGFHFISVKSVTIKVSFSFFHPCTLLTHANVCGRGTTRKYQRCQPELTGKGTRKKQTRKKWENEELLWAQAQPRIHWNAPINTCSEIASCGEAVLTIGANKWWQRTHCQRQSFNSRIVPRTYFFFQRQPLCLSN